MSVIMIVIVAAASLMRVLVVMMMIVVMRVIMTTTVCPGVLRGGSIEEPEHDQSNAREEHHGTKNAVGREVVYDASTRVKVEQHAPPQEQKGDADEMNGVFRRGHGFGVARV
jgi:hypothetical protein